jgi:hypothetical protein
VLSSERVRELSHEREIERRGIGYGGEKGKGE